MSIKGSYISIKTLTDDHLEKFMNCSFKFYYQDILKAVKQQYDWFQITQYVVNQIVKQFFEIHPKTRSLFTLFHLIDWKWRRVGVNVFESKRHYYEVTAKMTDHLLKMLMDHKNLQHPLFLYEKFRVFNEEIGIHLSMVFDVGEWTNQSYVLRKFLVSDKMEVVEAFKHMAIVVSRTAFQKLPEKMEFYSVLSGKVYEYFPTENDYKDSLNYLLLVKEVMKEPSNYIKNSPDRRCASCPLYVDCQNVGKQEFTVRRKLN
jgi:hypothetical protein